jgi:CcmD family protein
MEGQPSGTPFMVAGYLITWAVLAWYVWRLNRRSADAGRALESAPVKPHANEKVESDG